ncbi:CBL-interacting protein kinase 28 [Dichanthelium oligosanthes]|uniref:non-specific serine/threonine protein kinase n=1 Tax=Dichanthelium oligosanthes TaxID=888268 RepID=A0A1E5WB45_9POAL|nr:CBL-interacting protein kinase 28 [Dichanthelium oligosanthes]
MEERSVLMERYEIGRLLGQGTFAKVYYARNLATGQTVAIKMINKDKIVKTGLMDQIKREISIMRLVRHPNILQPFEVMATKNKIYFILEYAKGGELFNKIAKGKLTEEAARKYFQQLISAVDYCHSRAESKRQDGLLHTACGTPAYVAPEVLSRKGYSGTKADVWSCGVILFVLAASYLPFHERNLIEMYKKISKAEYRCPCYFSEELKALLYGMLDPDPNTRMPISIIKRSAWYRKPLGLAVLKAETVNKTCTEATISGLTDCVGFERNQGSLRLTNLNAFDIISLSTGFDLSLLFDEKYSQREARFTSKQSAAAVFGKLKELARRLKLKATKKDGGVLKLATAKEGRKGILELDAEIFEIAPSFVLVELKKINGDTLEYQELMKDGIRPSLEDIVWAWQGDQQQSLIHIHAGQQQPQLPPLLPFPLQTTVVIDS